jgi:hypothetical protein
LLLTPNTPFSVPCHTFHSTFVISINFLDYSFK